MLADAGLGHEQPIDVEIVVVLRVRDRRFERLPDVVGDPLARELQRGHRPPGVRPRIRPATRSSLRGLVRSMVAALITPASAGMTTRASGKPDRRSQKHGKQLQLFGSSFTVL